MARIAMIVSNPCLSDARVLKMVEVAKLAGHEVHVFATLGQGGKPFEVVDGVSFHRFEWNPGSLLRSKWYMKVLKFIVPIKMVQGFVVKNLAKWKKFGLFSELMSEKILAIAPDIIHAHDLICLPTGAAVAKESGCKLIYDAHELEVHRNPPLPFFLKRYTHYLEKKYAQKANEVITVGRFVSGVLGKSINRKDIHVLYNSPIVEDTFYNIRADLQLDSEVPILLYVGKVTMGRGVGDILNILPKIPGVFFAAVGPSDLRTSKILLRKASRLGVLDRFRILPPVPYKGVVSYISGATVGLLSVEPVTLSYQYCMPNKLFEMTFADVPILANELDEVKEFISEIGNGKIVDFADTNSLPYEIQMAISNREGYLHNSKTKQLLLEQYSWSAQAQKLRSIYDKHSPHNDHKGSVAAVKFQNDIVESVGVPPVHSSGLIASPLDALTIENNNIHNENPVVSNIPRTKETLLQDFRDKYGLIDLCMTTRANIPSYRALCQILKDSGKENITMHEQAVSKRNDVYCIRHDVDHDLEHALIMAMIEADLGVVATYYLLPPGDYESDENYYGEIQDGKIVHTDRLKEAVKLLTALGHEVGLHNDFTQLAIKMKREVREVFKAEVDFLTSLGAKVTGSASHGSLFVRKNSFLNYEIFSDCVKPNNKERIIATTEPSLIEYKLGALTFEEVGLSYEAYHMPYNTYLSDVGANFSVTARKNTQSRLYFEDAQIVDLDSISSFIKENSDGALVCLVHPDWWKVTTC